MDHSVAKIDHRIIINSKTPEMGKASTNMQVSFSLLVSSMHKIFSLFTRLRCLSRIVLDVSSLKGGAPGRTRGLDIYTMDSFLDGLACINH